MQVHSALDFTKVILVGVFMFKKFIAVLILLSLSQLSFAKGNSTWGLIEELYFGSAGNYVRVTMDASDSQAFCGESGNPYILYLDQSSEVTKEFYKTRLSVLLAAFAAGKNVQFWLQNTECSPQKEPKIYGVNIKN